MCEYCEKRNENEIKGKDFELIPTAGFKNDRRYSSWIMKNKDDEKAGIGEYIRTKDGFIVQLYKVLSSTEKVWFGDVNYGMARCNIFGLNQILVTEETALKCKHSFEIIDLIEVRGYFKIKEWREVGSTRPSRT